ncbi:MAG: Jag N-terminal domain-containing protein, partial [Oscillospiraceae bacterium]|nr:Jag N-terminal domain-containing protein [Oscillospiraceae bacterium]
MMEKIYTAKTEEAAKEQAVNEFAACGIEESDIEFEILETSVKKLFRVSGEYKIRAFAAEPVKTADEEAPAIFEEEEQVVSAPADGVNPLESEKVKNAVKYLTK